MYTDKLHVISCIFLANKNFNIGNKYGELGLLWRNNNCERTTIAALFYFYPNS